ncbi:MAG: hypothetical protein J6R82_02025 [Clostridia bacterium]|nr:hypothetical protein [Clostridia bacterium]
MNESTFEPIPDPESTEVPAAPAAPAEAPAAPMTAEEEPLFMLSGKKRKVIWPFIVLPIAVLLLVGGIFAFWFTRPETILKQTMGNYVSSWVMDNELLTSFATADQSGRIHLELNNRQIYKDPLTMDLFAPTKKGRVARIATEDEELFVYTTPNALMFGDANDEESVYGIKPSGIYQQFERSIFFPKADGKYAIPLYQHQIKDMENALAQFERVYQAEFSDSTDALGDKYVELFFDCLLNEAEIEVTKQEQSRMMEITLAPEALEDAINIFFTTLTEDPEFIAYLNTYSPKDPLVEQYDTWEEEFEHLKTEAERTAENCRILGITLTVRMEYTPFTRQLQSISIAMDSPEEPKLRALLDATQPGKASFTMNVKGLDALALKLTQTDYEFHVELSARNERGVMTNVFDLHYTEDQSGDYRLVLSTREDNLLYEYTLSGTTSKGDGVLRFTCDKLHLKVTVPGQGYAEDSEKIGLTVELYEEGKSLKFPKKYKNLLAISEEKMDALAEENNTDPDEITTMLKELCDALLESTVSG